MADAGAAAELAGPRARLEPVRKKLRVSAKWLASNASNISEIEAQTPQQTPCGVHAERRIIARFDGPVDEEQVAYEDRVRYTLPVRWRRSKSGCCCCLLPAACCLLPAAAAACCLLLLLPAAAADETFDPRWISRRTARATPRPRSVSTGTATASGRCSHGSTRRRRRRRRTRQRRLRRRRSEQRRRQRSRSARRQSFATAIRSTTCARTTRSTRRRAQATTRVPRVSMQEQTRALH